MKEIRIQLFGRVQGVNLRRRMRQIAESFNLKGYVQNLEDGSMDVVAQGNEEQIYELLSWIQKGHFPAQIKGMRFDWQDNINHQYSDFSINKSNIPFIVDEAHSLINLGKTIINPEEINVPNHVAIIPDGNRRWAREKGWKAWVGHQKASEIQRVSELIYECKDLGVKYLTFWAFSTENWSRDKREVNEIFKLIVKRGPQLKVLMHKEKIKFRHLGRKDRLPKDVMEVINDLVESTKDFTNLNFQFCLDYGGRYSIVEAVNKMIKAGLNEIDEDTMSKYLESSDLPDPDLIIRTSGEKRTSGIMPFESVYAELYFTNIYFPDFDAEQFKRAILDYSARTRRFGGTAKTDLMNNQQNILKIPQLI